MTEITVYKVVFRGIILPGYKQEQVIDNIHKITKIPREVIEKKFFSGKNVVIRHADTTEYAKRLQQIFSEAGIETSIEAQSTLADENLTDNTYTEDSQQPSIDAQRSADNKTVRKLLPLLVVLIIGLIATLGYILLLPKLQEKGVSISESTIVNRDYKKSITVTGKVSDSKLKVGISEPLEFFIQINNRQEHTKLAKFLTYLNARQSINELILASIKKQ